MLTTTTYTEDRAVTAIVKTFATADAATIDRAHVAYYAAKAGLSFETIARRVSIARAADALGTDADDPTADTLTLADEPGYSLKKSVLHALAKGYETVIESGAPVTATTVGAAVKVTNRSGTASARAEYLTTITGTPTEAEFVAAMRAILATPRTKAAPIGDGHPRDESAGKKSSRQVDTLATTDADRITGPTDLLLLAETMTRVAALIATTGLSTAEDVALTDAMATLRAALNAAADADLVAA